MNEDRDMEHTECPVCHDNAVRLESQNSGWFWKCRGKCGTFFPDANGEIILPAECPACGKPALFRLESQKLQGVFFWRCDCGAFYADQDGFPGKPFGEEETAPCPSCAGKAARKVYTEGPNDGEWYWHCDRCGDFRDADGVIGAVYDEVIQ